MYIGTDIKKAAPHLRGGFSILVLFASILSIRGIRGSLIVKLKQEIK
jgi:hypothetical protein